VPVTLDLADFFVGVTPTALPTQAMDHAAMVVASTLASAACGTHIRSAQIVRELACEQGGRPDASLWFHPGEKLPVSEVARVNAMLSDAAASDDSDLRNIVHAGTPLTATSLAFAERLGATGEDVLAAIAVGYEAAGRISEAITPGFRRRGFHGCLGAVFAAAVAAARLLQLDPPRMAQSIAIAATSIGGLATAADTSVAREYHAGLAAQLGVNAALAAERGFLAELRILETYQGFFESFGGADGAAGAGIALRDLGQSWDIVTDMAIKLVPGGHPYHAIGEAAAKASRQGNVVAKDVVSITISRPGMTALTGPLHPADLIDMAHSPAYFAAAGVADQAFSWQHASPEKIGDPTIHALIDKVRLGDPPEDDHALYRQGAEVSIEMRDGQVWRNTVHLPAGAGALGIAWSDVDAKFRTLMPMSGLTSSDIEATLTHIHAFRRMPDVSALIDLLRTPAKQRG
jgi:2-methylcitrate dehydratase PrpD